MLGWLRKSIFALRLNNFYNIMPIISIRGNEMPASPIRKLAPLADAAKQRGNFMCYHLNIGQPDLPTPRAALDAIRNIDRTVLEYSPSQGYRSYREKLVGYYKNMTSTCLPMISSSLPEVRKRCCLLF